ncbi:hypothetical protein HLRTI_002711 [Halorhabdus tiamatea SARL4B]|uniref:Uncharacterized protein n=1 Tax=Halorhabdus tiamatea SARL4B TaxID=1033806 RepID=F7PNN6_9EURY|nr:hypothetical protein [Halorhabdus tiamatea]ERJ05269.1 hypothetical protein HLRTI_002711 [Halorhabdus tiamatea SARL4B]CCQ33728.1 hypothetical protein HTIA_1601 [Halorhabdus tiamatea SARL4B]
MANADPLVRAARNGFLATILLLVAIGGYQFATSGTITTPVVATWVVAVLTFYASKYYYRRTDGDS